MIVGVSNYDNGQIDEGRAHVYAGSASGLSLTPSWTAEGDQADALFGRAVSGAGDVNGDGFNDVIVGASLDDNGQTNEGAVFLYLGSAAGLANSPAWRFESNQEIAFLGASVATAGDVNGDGFGDVVVSAPSYSNGEGDEGRAYLFAGSPSGLGQPAWTAEANQIIADFGTTVASAGDCNGDGLGDVIVGAQRVDVTFTDEGGAFLYLGGTGAPSGSPALTLVGSDQTTTLMWSMLTPAGSYDVVRGSLTALHDSAGDFTLSIDSCMASQLAAFDLPDTDTPVAGEGHWFLVRASNCEGHGTYDEEPGSQSGSRDLEINVSPFACP